MTHDHLVLRYGELALKGKNKKDFEAKLKQNVQQVLQPFPNVKVKRHFDRLYVLLNGEDYEPIVEKLQTVFGIHKISLAIKVDHVLEDMQHGALVALQETNQDAKTFKVTTKRPNKRFPYDSQKLNYLIGSYILSHTESLTVDVHHPDIEVRVEVKNDATYISCQHFEGAGGLPVGTSGKVMLLLSGGIDSPVAGYLTMKRGVEIEAVHFHSPPYTSERAKQKVEDLARVLTAFGGKIKLHVVHFTAVQEALKKEVPANYNMTIMRRIMLRITERLADQSGALAMATGESLGQVASQTLESMHTINEVTNYPVLRPLLAMDKVEITKISHKIGTYDISIRPYEDCCTIFLPPSPKTKPKREQANRFEQSLDIEALVNEALNQTDVITLQPGMAHDEAFDELF